jgi:hypothetical protein
VSLGPDSGGSFNPLDAAIRWGVETAVDVIGNVASGGPRGPTANQQQVLIDAGYTRTTGYRTVNWVSPTGQVIGNESARGVARQLIRNPPAAPIAPAAPASPTGPSVADQASIPGLPASIPLPNIPGLPQSIPLPPIVGPIITQALPAVIAAGLFWPTTAGQGSDLRDLYAVPKPRTGTGRRSRRRRARARPATRPVAGNPFPAVPKGRGGPVTISRGNARALPAPVATARNPYQPGPKIPPVTVSPPNIRVSAPATIPSNVWQTAQRAVASIPTPIKQAAVGGLLALLTSNLSRSRVGAQLGRVTLPGTSALPTPALSPLTAVQNAGLSYARALSPAQSLAQEQDCSCRPVRKKRKKDACKNPVTSRRSFKRDGKKFVTTTKELKCQASSRKKPSLPRVR